MTYDILAILVDNDATAVICVIEFFQDIGLRIYKRFRAQTVSVIYNLAREWFKANFQAVAIRKVQVGYCKKFYFISFIVVLSLTPLISNSRNV